MIIFSTAKRRKRSRRCPQQLVDILAVHITIRTLVHLLAFSSLGGGSRESSPAPSR